MKEFLNTKLYDNTIQEYLIAITIILLTFIIIQIFKRIFLVRVKKVAESAGLKKFLFIEKSINRFLIPALYLGAVYAAIEALTFAPHINKTIGIVYAVIVAWFIIRFTITALNYFLDKYLERLRGKDDSTKLRPLIALVNFVVWIIGLLFLLDNLGFQVSAIVTGLGITGIAVALAAQALLGDLFSYIVIFFDRPFEIGDFVRFEGNAGNIEKIGIKTTHVRSIDGELLIVSNSKLTSTLVHNFKRMERRRVLFKLGVTYQTKHEKLAEIPSIVKEIIQKQELVEFDRGHFLGFGDFSLNFEFVYFVLSSDFITHSKIQESINLEIHKEFERRGVDFAYPTQTLFLNKENE